MAIFWGTPQKARVSLFTIGAVTFAATALSWPLITGVMGDKTPSKIYGSVECILAGILVAVAGIMDLVTSRDVRTPDSRNFMVVFTFLLVFLSLGYSVRLIKYAEVGPPTEYVWMTVIISLILAACGSYAVWIGAGG
ncbi:hypothetical protein AB0N14_27400 [Streptomyces sp. NPDC051104]|uniref:hypothetical protein n=1 Tax=Streptomyces sp. NPDC051104 TaxID=3155044 RepID=UPI003442729A